MTIHDGFDEIARKDWEELCRRFAEWKAKTPPMDLHPSRPIKPLPDAEYSLDHDPRDDF